MAILDNITFLKARQIPKAVTELHHEVELGVVIKTKGVNIPAQSASSHIGGYVVAFDMTARNIQSRAKKAGSPWTVAKVSYGEGCSVCGK